jgi:hypothetical protein
MRMETRRRWAALLLWAAVWAAGCATVPDAPGRGASLHQESRAGAALGWTGEVAETGEEGTPRLHRRRGERSESMLEWGSGPYEEAWYVEEEGEEFLPPGPPTCGGQPVPPGWPDFSSSEDAALLAPFLTCTSPAEFLALQERVDMPRLVERLDDWHAVRLGALGPLRTEAARVLHRKRADFLVAAAERYGAYAEVFALFVVASAFDDDMHEVLLLLARDKQLAATLGHMPSLLDVLAQRGLRLEDYPERGFQKGDVLRGLGRFGREALATSPMVEGGRYMEMTGRLSRLPPAYQEDFHALEKALMARHFSPGNVVVGTLDSATFGVPMGFYHLVAGTGRGLGTLSEGHYEQAVRELAPAVLLVGLYAGGKGMRAVSKAREWGGVRGLQRPEVHLERLREVTERLRRHLGADGLSELTRYIRASREAALLVAEGGELGAAALYEARGQVPRARAWLSQAKPPRGAGPGGARGGVRGRPGGLAALVDEGAGLTAEVVEAKLGRVEWEVAGPRLSGNVAALERQRPSLQAPPVEAGGHPLWGEYVAYYEGRLAELRQGLEVKQPLTWAGYERMRGQFARGLAFERDMVALLRADAALPRAQRRFLQDFDSPRVEVYVGVRKPGSGLRYADVLVIEQRPPSGQLPRVETFSFKSRDFSQMGEKPLMAQLTADASEALRYYGETLDIRRPSLKHLVPEGQEVRVQRVRLLYEGGGLKPKNPRVRDAAVNVAQTAVTGVEVHFQ